MSFTPYYGTTLLILHIHFALLRWTKVQARKVRQNQSNKAKIPILRVSRAQAP